MKNYDVFFKDAEGAEVKKVEDVPLVNGAAIAKRLESVDNAVEIIFRPVS